MRSAAEREDATEKSAVTPGPIAPARELLGDMLVELKEPAQALQEYEATLQKEPNRRYFQELLKICARADKPERPELIEARRVLAAK